jgi:hypothetical protein
MLMIKIDAPPSSLMDESKVKTMEGEGVGRTP